MKFYLEGNQLPTSEQFTQWNAALQNVKYMLQGIKVSLSMEERRQRRKMGSRRLAYASAAERRCVQHEQVMPRQFNTYYFSQLMTSYIEMSRLLSYLDELHEMLDDTLTAMGIDAMTCTKVVHDSLRIANLLDPSLDGALQELDEFNKRAQAEDSEEDTTNIRA
ncbi:MAG: hypothetical protein ACK4TA_07250 [Saprospiraceae bacterium]